MIHGLKVIAVVLVDSGFVCTIAWMMWWNAGQTVADLSLPALTLTTLTGSVIMFFRFLVMQPLKGDTSRVVVIAILQICAATALVVTWTSTGSYLLGWFATCASLLLITGSVLQLLVASAAGVRRSGARSDRPDVGLVTGVSACFVALAGFIGLFLTAPIHDWSPHVINMTIAIAAVSLVSAGASAHFARSTPTQPRRRAATQRASEETSERVNTDEFDRLAS